MKFRFGGPAWEIFYKGANITSRIDSMVCGVTYTSDLDGAASDAEIELEDRDRRWQGPWFPVKGDQIGLLIGYDNGSSLADCGSFEVDEVALDGEPDVVKMRCISAGIRQALRSPNSSAFENQTLLQIAGTIAAKYGFTVIGSPANINIAFKRKTQRLETDLAFLHRIAEEHGYEFTVRGQQLIFHSRTELEASASIGSLDRASGIIKSFEFKSLSRLTFQNCVVSWQDPDSKKLIVGTATNTDAPVATADTIRIANLRCESAADATLKAQAALHSNNMGQINGSLETVGNTRLAAGSNLDITGFGQFDGKYQIRKGTHELKRPGGYTTRIEVRSV